MAELALFRVTLKNGTVVDEFYFEGKDLKWNDADDKQVWETKNGADANNFQKIKQIVGISYKLKIVQDSGGKIKSDFLKKRKNLMEKIYGQLAIFILKSMNSIIWLKEPTVAGLVGKGGELSEVGLERALVFALDIAENIFPLYKEIVNIHFPSGVSQDITKLERDEFIADKRKEFGIIKSKKDK